MDACEDQYQQFTEVVSEEELRRLAAEYGVVDQRERKLPVRIFFWLMVLSAGQPTVRGALFQLVAFFVAALSKLFPTAQAFTLTKMALSHKLKQTDWFFFRGVYTRLLVRYRRLLPPSQRTHLEAFEDAFILDATISRVHTALKKVFRSVHKEQAACKIHLRYSLKNLAPNKLQVTDGKRHDSRFRGITQQPGVLYLFDLGYWSFTRLHKIIQACSFFVCRLKSTCDPLIVSVSQRRWQSLIGKRLSEILDLLEGEAELDVRVKLSKAEKPRFSDEIRLVGIFHQGIWHFYLSNIFQAAFTPKVIYDLYRQRWSVEIFFNFFKHLLHIEHLICRTRNGIMVEIYSALIFYLLTQIVIGLAARKTGKPIESFSFQRSFQLVRAFLMTHLSCLLDRRQAGLSDFLGRLVEAVALLGFRDKLARSP
jgi:hypothetical protein